MARPKKDEEMLHCRIDRTISENLDKLCEETGLTKTTAVERALKTYITLKNTKSRAIHNQKHPLTFSQD